MSFGWPGPSRHADFFRALEDTSPHEPAYDQRRCVIAVGMETAPCCEVSTRASAYSIRL
jgi:hypothetical protein